MEIIYSKFSTHRLECFQIATYIAKKDNNEKIVIKKALTPQSVEHIKKINSGYILLNQKLQNNNLILPNIYKYDNENIIFEYIEGKSLDEELFNCFLQDNKSEFLNLIDKYVWILKNSLLLYEKPNFSDDLYKIFKIEETSNFLKSKLPSISPATIDLIFENIMVNEGKYYFIDPEWIFEGALPYNYYLFRSLFYFYKVKYLEFEVDKWLPLCSLFEKYKITEFEQSFYNEMEENFQKYVFGQPKYFEYKEKYVQNINTIDGYEKQINHYKVLLTERELLLNNIFNSRSWKIIKKIESVINTICPTNSLRRKLLEKILSLVTK